MSDDHTTAQAYGAAIMRWLEAEDRTVSWLGRQVGVQRQQFWRYATGKHLPRSDVQERLSELSAGEIPTVADGYARALEQR